MKESDRLEQLYNEAMKNTQQIYDKYELKFGDVIPHELKEIINEITNAEFNALVLWQDQLEREVK